MKLVSRKPKHPLHTVVKSLWKLELLPSDVPYSQVYFPYGAFELIFYLGNPGVMNYLGSAEHFAQPRWCYSGPLTRPFHMAFHEPTTCLGVSLMPWTGNMMLRMPGSEFTNQIIDLHLLRMPELDVPPELDDNGMLEALEDCMVKYLIPAQKDAMVEFLTRAIIDNPTRQNVERCLDQVGLSRRRIEQRFLNSTGLNMGTFTRKARFQKAVRALGSFSDGMSLTGLGLEVGYFDQSHFISEFREFTSLTPSKFLKDKSELKDLLVSIV